MNPHVAHLEHLRAAAQRAESEMQELGDYLDRGCASCEAATCAHGKRASASGDFKSLKRQLRELLGTLRKEDPSAIDLWVRYHTGVCDHIIANQKRAFVVSIAETTRDEWGEVLRGKRAYVRIHPTELSEYLEEATALAGSWDGVGREAAERGDSAAV